MTSFPLFSYTLGMSQRQLNGTAVKALREALGLPGSTFSITCGMTPGHLSNIEANRKTPPPDVARRIANELAKELAKRTTPRGRPAPPIDVWLAVTYPATPEVAAA